MYRAAIVLMTIWPISATVLAKDFATVNNPYQHDNRYGLGTFYGQYPQLVEGQEKGEKLLLAQRLYDQALLIESKGGFDSSRNQAVQMWEKSAQYGNDSSGYETGFAYYVGSGADVDVPKANIYLEYAAKRGQENALGLYLVSQVYDSKYRKLSNNELISYVEQSVQKQNNVYGLLAYLKMYQDGIIKSKNPNRQAEIINVIKIRMNDPKANRVEKYHLPLVLSVLKIKL